MTNQIECLLAALKKGRVFVQKGDEYVGLTFPSAVNANIEASQTKTRERLCIRLSWARSEAVEQYDDPKAELRILDSEPAVAPLSEEVDEDDPATAGSV